MCGLAVLACLSAAVYFTGAKPAKLPAGNSPAQVQTAPALSPFDATLLALECADAGKGEGVTLKLEPSVDRWFLLSSTSADGKVPANNSMAQTSVVRGAQTLLRDALQQPGSMTPVPQSGSGTSWSRVQLATDRAVHNLLVERQALGGRTRIISLPAPIAGSDPWQTGSQAVAHPGSADVAKIFSAASITAWRDVSAFPDLGTAVQELTIKTAGHSLRVARAPGESRWMLVEPVPAPAETSAVDQLLGVLRALKLADATPVSPSLAAARSLDGQGSSVTVVSTLRGANASEQRVEQLLSVGSQATATGNSRWVVGSTHFTPLKAHVQPSAEGSIPSFGGLTGSLEVQPLLDFAKTAEGLVARSAVRATLGDIGSLSLVEDGAALASVGLIAPHEPSARGLKLIRSTNAQRAELRADWVVPSVTEPLLFIAATPQQQQLAQALCMLITTTPPSSMLLLRDPRSIEAVFDFGRGVPETPANMLGTGVTPANRAKARCVASVHVRDMGGASLETGALGVTISGTPSVLLRVGRVLRVWEANQAPAKDVFEALPREIVPEG